MGRRKNLKKGDKVRYTIPGDIDREWAVVSTFPVVDGTMLCLSRPDEEKRLKVDRCNAEEINCVLVK